MSEEKETGTLTIKLRKDDIWKYSTFILAAILVVGAIFYFTNGNSDKTGNVVVDDNQQLPSGSSEVRVSVDDDPVLGDEDAPVTIIEFSDYQCPFCQRFWAQTLPSIKQQYIDTGKVRFVYRDFPLTSIHPMAQPAAEAAECVREQGGDDAYWEMHDKIFENQASLSEANLKKWASDLGYNIGNCLDSDKFKSEVQNDLSDATSSGGRGTPYFIVLKTGDSEGTPISGAVPFATFQQAIENKLE